MFAVSTESDAEYTRTQSSLWWCGCRQQAGTRMGKKIRSRTFRQHNRRMTEERLRTKHTPRYCVPAQGLWLLVQQLVTRVCLLLTHWWLLCRLSFTAGARNSSHRIHTLSFTLTQKNIAMNCCSKSCINYGRQKILSMIWFTWMKDVKGSAAHKSHTGYTEKL